ncbi:MAG: mechanosensitive ion channel family protein [Alistipes senegalensis]|nr:mechanosensitive ion channel family protein [Oxalobacter formigenes]MCM1281175.1 mechanosensitive ion channel family protein [Alistipes senegalensis]
MEQIQTTFSGSPVYSMMAALAILIAVSCFANFVVKRLLLAVIRHALRMTPFVNDNEIVSDTVISRLANIIPALVFTLGIPFVPAMPETVTAIVRNTASAFIILTLALAVAASLDVVNTWYARRPDADSKPIKGYLQILKIGIYLISAILVIAALIDKSPVILLSGLGAMAAVLMLIFQDTLLSLVASVQLASNDMLRVGDWIEAPQLHADGVVIDIALHTVKVQNWDRTITTLPTRRLISDAFKNWRGMQESGGRRIRRALYIDQGTIRFLTEAEKACLQDFDLLKTLLSVNIPENCLATTAGKAQESSGIETVLSGSGIINIGLFRFYVREYLKNRKDICQDATLIVRQMDPGAEGLPLEIYCFAATTDWSTYEDIQSSVFDHFYAVLPAFGLRAYQRPSGYDMQEIRLGRP